MKSKYVPKDRRLTALRVAAALAVAAVALPSHAEITNGSFEEGFTGWNTSGVTAILATGGNGPVDGPFQAYLDTSPSDETAGPHSSMISQTFSGSGNISFWFNFATNEPRGSDFNDSAWVVLDGVSTKLADTFSSLTSSTLGGYADMTGYQHLSLSLNGAGTHTISFMVMDGVDGAVDSALLIDNVVTAVPEPTTFLLTALGIAGLGLMRRRELRKQS